MSKKHNNCIIIKILLLYLYCSIIKTIKMKVQLSNQPRKGEIYYGVRIYNKNGVYIGSHNGYKKTKKIHWFVKTFIDMFIDELYEKAKIVGIKIVIVEKIF